MAWNNSDGLLIKYGYEEAQVGGGGEFAVVDDVHTVEFDIRWNMLNAFGTRTILDETVRIPNGVIIISALFTTEVPFTSGGAATLSVGLCSPDRTTVFSATGLINATALTTMDAVGEVVTGAGASLNTVLANAAPNLIQATVGTANYTAGRGKLRIRYFVPSPAPAIVGALA